MHYALRAVKRILHYFSDLALLCVLLLASKDAKDAQRLGSPKRRKAVNDAVDFSGFASLPATWSRSHAV